MEPSFITVARNFYRRFAGPEALLSSIPLAVLRALCGSDMTVRIDGKPFTVNLDDTIVSFHLLAYRRYEVLETALVRRIVRAGDFAVDAGANIGYFSVLLGELVGCAGRVLAVEPEPNNARLLRKNVKLRGLTDIVFVAQAAIGDTVCTATLYKSLSGNQGDHRMYAGGRERDGRAKDETMDVSMTTMDTLVLGWSRVDFIKMDIQGFEPSAIRGMSQVLTANDRVLLLTEFWPFGIRSANGDPLDFLKQLRVMGFQLWEVSDNNAGLHKLSPDADAALVARIEPDKRYINLLCSRYDDVIQSVRTIS